MLGVYCSSIQQKSRMTTAVVNRTHTVRGWGPGVLQQNMTGHSHGRAIMQMHADKRGGHIFEAQ